MPKDASPRTTPSRAEGDGVVEDARSIPERAFDAVRLGGPERPPYECCMCGLGLDRYDRVCRHCGYEVTSDAARGDPESFESWRVRYLSGGLVRGPFPWSEHKE